MGSYAVCNTDGAIEPAQEAVRSKLFCPLIDALARESFDNGPLLGYICPLLTFSLDQCKE